MGRWLPDPSFFFPTLDPLLRIKCSRTPHRKKRMTSLTDYAKNMLGRSVVGRRPTLPSAVFVASAPGTLTHIGVFDAQTGGNPLLWAPLATPVTLNVPGVVNIPVNSMTVLGD
jgi:hypothetical protein